MVLRNSASSRLQLSLCRGWVGLVFEMHGCTALLPYRRMAHKLEGVTRNQGRRSRR
jgi:hypothetical protein